MASAREAHARAWSRPCLLASDVRAPRSTDQRTVGASSQDRAGVLPRGIPYWAPESRGDVTGRVYRDDPYTERPYAAKDRQPRPKRNDQLEITRPSIKQKTSTECSSWGGRPASRPHVSDCGAKCNDAAATRVGEDKPSLSDAVESWVICAGSFSSDGLHWDVGVDALMAGSASRSRPAAARTAVRWRHRRPSDLQRIAMENIRAGSDLLRYAIELDALLRHRKAFEGLDEGCQIGLR